MRNMMVVGLASMLLACVAIAGPGEGIRSGPWTIVPYAGVSGTYDSNIGRTSTDKVSDEFFDSTLGLRLGYSSYLVDFSGLGFLSSRVYADDSDSDFGSGGELLRLKYGNRDQVEVEVDQTFRNVTDVDRYGSEAAVGGVSPDSVLDISARSQRDINQAGISAGKNVTDKLELDAGYRFDDVRYEEASLADLQDHVGQVEVAYKVTEKTAGLATVKGAVQKNVSLDDSADYYAARLGLKTKGTDKVTFKGGAGLQRYSPADGDANTGFNFDFSASWAARDRVIVEAGGRNGSVLSSLYSDNGTDYQVEWLAVIYRVLPSLTTTLSGAYRVDDYMNRVTSGGVVVDRKDRGVAGRLRAEYQAPAKFIKVYSEATYEEVASNVADYNDVRFALGAVLSY